MFSGISRWVTAATAGALSNVLPLWMVLLYVYTIKYSGEEIKFGLCTAAKEALFLTYLCDLVHAETK